MICRGSAEYLSDLSDVCNTRETAASDPLYSVNSVIRYIHKVVVGGCHSLMNLDGVLHGDPLEASALEGIRWHWNATSHTARPLHSSSDGLRETPISNHDKADSPPPASSSPSKSHPKALSNKTVEASEAAEKSEEAHGEEAAVEGLIDEDGVDGAIKGVAGGVEDATGVAVAVWRRYAFSSQLQRMSVVAEVSGTGLTADLDAPEVRQGSNRKCSHPESCVALCSLCSYPPPLILLRSLLIV